MERQLTFKAFDAEETADARFGGLAMKTRLELKPIYSMQHHYEDSHPPPNSGRMSACYLSPPGSGSTSDNAQRV
jgi:hypothetical protein